MTQLAHLNAIIRAAEQARAAAERGDLFVSREGFALVNAMHDLTEVDELYDLAGDVAAQAGIEREPSLGAIYRTIAKARSLALPPRETARVTPVLEMVRG